MLQNAPSKEQLDAASDLIKALDLMKAGEDDDGEPAEVRAGCDYFLHYVSANVPVGFEAETRVQSCLAALL